LVEQRQRQGEEEVEVAEGDEEYVGGAGQLVRRLMLPEDQQTGEVEWAIFKEYIRLNGGYCKFGVLICLGMLLWIVLTIGSSIIVE
jgi:hypothetical protein